MRSDHPISGLGVSLFLEFARRRRAAGRMEAAEPA